LMERKNWGSKIGDKNTSTATRTQGMVLTKPRREAGLLVYPGGRGHIEEKAPNKLGRRRAR